MLVVAAIMPDTNEKLYKNTHIRWFVLLKKQRINNRKQKSIKDMNVAVFSLG